MNRSIGIGGAGFVRLWLLAAGLAATCLPGAAQADLILTDPALVSYWLLDEPAGTTGTGSVKDAKATNHGTPTGAVTFGQPSAMLSLGTAAGFSGASGTRIDIPYAAAINPAVFTAQAWARVDAATGDYQGILSNRYTGSGARSGYTFYATNTHQWYLQAGDGVNWQGLSGPPVINGQWVHLAATHDGSLTRFFMNGHPVGSITAALGQNFGSPLRIGAGAAEGSGAYWLNGRVDNVAVFNAALAHQTISNHYNSFSSYATEVLAAGPVGYWRLGEQAGTTAYNAANVAAHAGTYTAGPVLRQIGDTALAGDMDTSVDFDGVDDRVTIPYSTALNPANLTVSVWAKVEGGAGTYRSPVTSRTYLAGTQGYILYAGMDNRWQFWTGSGTGNWHTLGGPLVVENQWTQVVGTFDSATGTKQMYVNGQLYGSVPGAYAPLTASANVLAIGAGGDGGDSFRFNGKLDEVAVYGRPLSRAEIARQYEIGQKGAAEPDKIFGVTYTYSAAPNADPTYYRDDLKLQGSFSGDLADLLTLSGGYQPSDTSVGWLSGTPVTITFDLGGLYTIHNIKIGYSNYAPYDNDAPDDVQVAFSTDGVNFSTPVLYTGFTGTALHNDLMLGIMNPWATHARLIFDGGTANGRAKYLLDEVTFYEGVPEPSSFVLLGLGGAALAWLRRARALRASRAGA